MALGSYHTDSAGVLRATQAVFSWLQPKRLRVRLPKRRLAPQSAAYSTPPWWAEGYLRAAASTTASVSWNASGPCPSLHAVANEPQLQAARSWKVASRSEKEDIPQINRPSSGTARNLKRPFGLKGEFEKECSP
jgi:hypothetical protein